MRLFTTVLLLVSVAAMTSAQMQFFEQLFNTGGGGGGGQQHHQQQRGEQNVASDSEWYQRTYDGGKPCLNLFSCSFCKTESRVDSNRFDTNQANKLTL